MGAICIGKGTTCVKKQSGEVEKDYKTWEALLNTAPRSIWNTSQYTEKYDGMMLQNSRLPLQTVTL